MFCRRSDGLRGRVQQQQQQGRGACVMSAAEEFELGCSAMIRPCDYTKWRTQPSMFFANGKSTMRSCVVLSRADTASGGTMEIRTDFVTLSVNDGTSMRAYVARPSASPAKNGLIVAQEAFGVNAHIRDVTERFAREGYVAIAPELFHRTAPGFDCRYDEFPTAMGQLQKLKSPEIEADMRGAHDWLRKE